ncbi:MAG: hypothetical protein QW035_01085 [Candidatus Anstonellales archaeon]
MKLKLIKNPKKRWAEHILKKVREEAVRRGWQVVGGGADATIVIGGDGTFYYHKEEVEGQVFSIGSEHSWLGVPYKRWKDVFDSKKWKEYLVKGIDVYEGTKKVGWAINDVYLRARDTVVRIKVTCGANYSFIGDGIIVSTPIGSTAYNFSCGGPLLDWGVNAFAITGIAPHLRAFLPVVYKGNVKISWEGKGDIFLDGQRKTIKKNSILLVEGRQLRMMRYAYKRD